jgi:hypothetical protein
MAHFARVFGIRWAITTALSLSLGGEACRPDLAWPGLPGRPLEGPVVDLFFYFRPAVPAALIAAILELPRMPRIGKHLGQRPQP